MVPLAHATLPQTVQSLVQGSYGHTRVIKPHTGTQTTLGEYMRVSSPHLVSHAVLVMSANRGDAFDII